MLLAVHVSYTFNICNNTLSSLSSNNTIFLIHVPPQSHFQNNCYYLIVHIHEWLIIPSGNHKVYDHSKTHFMHSSDRINQLMSVFSISMICQPCYKAPSCMGYRRLSTIQVSNTCVVHCNIEIKCSFWFSQSGNK